MSEEIKGGCLCGRVEFQVSGPFESFHICHCSQCRRSTGSAHASNIFSASDKITWLKGQELVKRFDPDVPGSMISKSFCSHCGSLVPYISASSGKLVIPAGSLNGDPTIRPQDNIFWKNRADWYDSVSEAPRYDAYPDK